MEKNKILDKLREIASSDNVTVNKHLEVDDQIRWYWSWQAAEQIEEMTTKDLAELYFDGGLKPYSTIDDVIKEIDEMEFNDSDLKSVFSHFENFLKGELNNE